MSTKTMPRQPTRAAISLIFGALLAIAIALVDHAYYVSVAAAADNRPPRLTGARMDDADDDGRTDGVVLTYSEPIRHVRDADGRYQFAVAGRSVLLVPGVRGADTLRLRLAEPSGPDPCSRPWVRYVFGQPGSSVRDMAGNRAWAQLFERTTPVSGSMCEKPKVSLRLTGSPFSEHGGAAAVEVQLSATTARKVTVQLAASGSAVKGVDYSLSAATVAIAAGETAATVMVTGIDDAAYEGNESVILDVAAVTNATEARTQRVTAVITSDDRDPRPPHFGDGTWRVGEDIEPGTYRTRAPADGCYWERLSGFSGELDDIIANEFSDETQVVTIASTDAGFSSERCGTWTQDLSAITNSPTASFGDGTYIVGTDIAAGTWRNSGTTNCYWERLSGFSGTLDDIIANEFSSVQQIVTIEATDRGFKAHRCGTWTKIS